MRQALRCRPKMKYEFVFGLDKCQYLQYPSKCELAEIAHCSSSFRYRASGRYSRGFVLFSPPIEQQHEGVIQSIWKRKDDKSRMHTKNEQINGEHAVKTNVSSYMYSTTESHCLFLCSCVRLWVHWKRCDGLIGNGEPWLVSAEQHGEIIIVVWFPVAARIRDPGIAMRRHHPGD